MYGSCGDLVGILAAPLVAALDEEEQLLPVELFALNLHGRFGQRVEQCVEARSDVRVGFGADRIAFAWGERVGEGRRIGGEERVIKRHLWWGDAVQHHRNKEGHVEQGIIR